MRRARIVAATSKSTGQTNDSTVSARSRVAWGAESTGESPAGKANRAVEDGTSDVGKLTADQNSVMRVSDDFAVRV